jgi:hypothetical protein
MIINYLFLPVFFLIGLIASYEDFRYGKIKNKWILVGVIWFLVIYLFLITWNFVGPFLTNQYYTHIKHLALDAPRPVFSVNFSFLFKTLINSLCAFLAAFLMWRAGAWSAGDAKLFFVFSLLIPISFYWKSFLPIFPSFALLINTFIPLMLLWVLWSFLYFLKYIIFHFANFKNIVFKKKKQDKKTRMKSLKSRGSFLLGFLGIFLFVRLFYEPAKLYFSINLLTLQMIIIPVLVIYSGKLAKWFEKPIVVKSVVSAMLIFFLLGLVFAPELTIKTLIESAQMMLVFIIVLTIFSKLINFYIETSGEEKARRIFPLAAWMFAGALLTLILKESVLSIILKMIY